MNHKDELDSNTMSTNSKARPSHRQNLNTHKVSPRKTPTDIIEDPSVIPSPYSSSNTSFDDISRTPSVSTGNAKHFEDHSLKNISYL